MRGELLLYSQPQCVVEVLLLPWCENILHASSLKTVTEEGWSRSSEFSIATDLKDFDSNVTLLTIP